MIRFGRSIQAVLLATLLLIAGCSEAPVESSTAAVAGSESNTNGLAHEAANHPVAHNRTSGGGHADHQALAAAQPLPGRSIYHLDASWTDHRGERVSLTEFRGHPTVVVMFYASCDTACPLLVRDALRLEEQLPAELREETRFVLVTIDPERDAPERLGRYVTENELGSPTWHFLTGPQTQTRALAALLGVQYRPAGNGMFSHTNLVTVLDRDGVVALRTEGLHQPTEPAVAAISAM